MSEPGDYSGIDKPRLPYQYEFAPDRLGDIVACNDARGFCVVKGLLSDELVMTLCAEVQRVVDPGRELGDGESRTHLWFIETATAAWRLFGEQRYLDLHRALLGTEDICVNRSAAIIRNAGSTPVGWHTDWCGQHSGPPQHTGDVLNRGPWPSGTWFYLTGSRPLHGGLCVIEGSHQVGWAGPEGFHLAADGRALVRDGAGDERYAGFDVPGLVPLFTDPGDCIVFADRTFHGAFPNREPEQRLSCAVGFRQKSWVIDAPWQLSPAGRSFVEQLPPKYRTFVDGYPGIDPAWKAPATTS